MSAPGKKFIPEFISAGKQKWSLNINQINHKLFAHFFKIVSLWILEVCSTSTKEYQQVTVHVEVNNEYIWEASHKFALLILSNCCWTGKTGKVVKSRERGRKRITDCMGRVGGEGEGD